MDRELEWNDVIEKDGNESRQKLSWGKPQIQRFSSEIKGLRLFVCLFLQQ